MHYGLDLLSRGEYEEWLREIPQGECPFCEWKKYQYVLHESRYWLWIACRSPYWKYHTLLIPKRHFTELNQITVVEMGEFIETYTTATNKFRRLNIVIDGLPVDRLLFFWRLRDSLHEEGSNTTRIGHFHVHLTPDRAGLIDPAIEENACDWDPKQLVI